MSLWVDKYRPTSLGKLDYHKEQATQLKNLVSKLKLRHISTMRSCVITTSLIYFSRGMIDSGEQTAHLRVCIVCRAA